MKAQCIICSDLFDTKSDVSATVCGHTFHQVCLLKWLEQSNSCPQCRRKITLKNIIMKLFFDISPDDSQIQDPDTLQNKMSELQAELMGSLKEKRAMQEEINKLHEIKCEVQTQYTSAIAALQAEEETTKALKIQMKFFTHKQSEHNEIKQENKLLKKKLSEMQSIQKIVNSQEPNIEKELEKCGDSGPVARGMATMCVLLKKELQNASELKKAILNEKARLQIELSASKKKSFQKEREVAKLQVKISELEAEVGCIREEKCSLNQKILELQKIIMNSSTPNARSNTSLSRILLESPAPIPKRPKLSEPTADSKENSEDKEEEVCSSLSSAGSESLDSGFLEGKTDIKFKVSTFPSAPLSEQRKDVPRNLPTFMSGYGIFQNKRPSSRDFMRTTLSKPGSGLSKGLSYDGFGGHAPSQDFPKPRPKQPQILKGLPKSKSTSQFSNLDKFFEL